MNQAFTPTDAAGARDLAPTPIAVAPGDGIGPEITAATLRILAAAGARLAITEVAIGGRTDPAKPNGAIPPDIWDTIRTSRVLLKAPLCPPQGAGGKSHNVSIRKSLGLFANVRPCRAYVPFVASRHAGMDLVVVRENEEDLYAGVEYRQSDEARHCLKIMSRPGCERIIRYAFEHARLHGRRKVTCMTKDNVMRLTDGLFRKVFHEIGTAYPDIRQEHMIVDIGAARLASRPGSFDVIVAPNLYGDILADIAAELAGSIGLSGSANVGEHAAMFEPIHGAARELAGKGVANPSAMLMSAVLMLVHIGQPEVAEQVHNAWLTTIEEGVHTADLHGASTSAGPPVSTEAFADAVIERLGRTPGTLPAIAYGPARAGPNLGPYARPVAGPRVLVGADLFLVWDGSAEDLAARVTALAPEALPLGLIANRGLRIWPDGPKGAFCTDLWRCRFESVGHSPLAAGQVVDLIARLSAAGLDLVKTENLYIFDGQPGFSMSQGH